MKMLALLRLPDHKLHHDLWEKSLHSSAPKIRFRVKREAVLLVPLFVEYFGQRLAREGR